MVNIYMVLGVLGGGAASQFGNQVLGRLLEKAQGVLDLFHGSGDGLRLEAVSKMPGVVQETFFRG
jgi:hypothetical protein